MKNIKNMIQSNDKDTGLRFSKIRIANLYDALDSLGYPNQCVDLDLKPLFNDQQRAGRALTVHGRRAPFSTDEVMEHERGINYHFVRKLVQPGCIVVIDGGGEPFTGIFGEMTSWGLYQRGAVGIVVDGYIRDYEGLLQLHEKTGFAVCARGTSPIEGRRRWSVNDVDVIIALPGTLSSQVRVAPGDWIVTGPDGIIVVPDEISMKALEISEDIELRENQMRKEIASGMDFYEASSTYSRE